MDFKQLVVDVLTEEALSSKCKFQPGDVVIIRAPYRAATRPFVHTIAKVENDRQQGNQIVLYRVKVRDGSSHYVSSSRLDGPFLDTKTAKKYLDPNIVIDPADIINRSVVLNDWQKRENTEAQLKAVLTAPPFNYEWIEPPIKSNEPMWGTRVPFILAQSPLKPDDLYLRRYNSGKTKKLSSEAYMLSVPPENIFSDLLQYNSLLDTRFLVSRVEPKVFLKRLEYYKQSMKAMELLNFDIFNPKRILINNNMLKHVLEECPLLNFLDGTYKTPIIINLDNVSGNVFKDCYVKDLHVCCTSAGNLTGCPDTVHGNFAVQGHLTSLKGCPKNIEGNFILYSVTDDSIHSVDFVSDFPEYIGGMFHCPQLGSEKSQQLEHLLRRKKALQDISDEAQNDPGLADLF